MKKYIACLLIGIGFIGNASAWTHTATSNDGMRQYIKFASYYENNGRVMVAWSNHIKISGDYSISRYEAHCASGMYRIVQVTAYLANGQVVPGVGYSYNPNIAWNYITPETMAEAPYKKLCS